MSIGGSRGKVSSSRKRGTSSNKQSGTVLNFLWNCHHFFESASGFDFLNDIKTLGNSQLTEFTINGKKKVKMKQGGEKMNLKEAKEQQWVRFIFSTKNLQNTKKMKVNWSPFCINNRDYLLRVAWFVRISVFWITK